MEKTLDYISPEIETLFEGSSSEIKKILAGDDINATTAVLGKIYKIPVSSYVGLSNIITYILLGALQPENVVRAIKEILEVDDGTAFKIATDLDKSILEKARIQTLGKAPTEMVELTFKEGRSEDDLRKEIMDTTKRESALVKEQTSTVANSQINTPAPTTAAPIVAPETSTENKVVPAAGSRSLLMEQLRVLDDIPDDEEIAARLAKIQEQIASINTKKDESSPGSSVPLQNFLLGEKSTEAKEPELQSATYSKAPTKYNVDPYREATEE